MITVKCQRQGPLPFVSRVDPKEKLGYIITKKISIIQKRGKIQPNNVCIRKT